MQINLGDYVRFVDEALEGYVTRILDQRTVEVTGKDGFGIPVLINKITKVQGTQTLLEDLEESNIIPEQPQDAGPITTRGIYIAVISDFNAKGVVHFKIVNDTSLYLMVSVITERSPKQFSGIFQGIIAPQSVQTAWTFSLLDINTWPSFYFQGIMYTQANVPPQPAIHKKITFKAKDFSGTQSRVGASGAYGWIFRLDEDEMIIDAQKLKESFFSGQAATTPALEKPQKEIDLHIEKICDDYHFLSNAEMLQKQISYFEQKLEAAIVHRLPSVVFIHGLGAGILKQEILKLLKKNKHVQNVQEADTRAYGYGATEVFLK